MNKIPLDRERLLRHLDEADAAADLAPKEFLMSQYKKPFRPLARLAARIVAYAAQVVTLQQRQFNRHIYEVVRLLATNPGQSAPGSAFDLIGTEAIKKRTQRQLTEFLASDRVLEFAGTDQPEISVLLVLYNQADLTLNCLLSLQRSTLRSMEVVIVDNASDDETVQLCQRIHGAKIIRNDRNRNFIEGANQAAKEAVGSYLLFLNSDTQLDPYAIEAAANVFKERPNAGAIGARIISPKGLIQEAGSIISETGACLRCGCDEESDSSTFSFRRRTDSVTRTFLLTPRHLFEDLGGFDSRFAPAYCEDADYCLRLWQCSKEVIYEPDALVLVCEGSGSQLPEAVNKLMRANEIRLVEKHRVWLVKNHRDVGSTGITQAALARYGGKKILYLDDRVPHSDLGSGFPRSQSIVCRLAEDANFVTFYPVRFPHEKPFTARAALGRDIEVASSLGLAGLEGFLHRRKGVYDTLWISRPHNLEYLADLIKARPELFSKMRIIYDAEAISCLRDIEQERLMGRTITAENIEKRVAEELEPARRCDTIVVTNMGEKAWFERLGFQKIQVIAYSSDSALNAPGFDDRKGFLFVGPVLEEYCPNADAIERLARNIFPNIKKTMGSEAQLCLVGYQGSKRIREIIRQNSDPQIQVAGQVPQVSVYLNQARVFIAPTRYASGVPIKVLEAAAHGLPCVATSLLANQLGWLAGSEILVADSDEEIAVASARLHSDKELWTRLRDGAQRRIRRDHNPAALSTALQHLLGSTTTS
jgi:GT2 family glycosyltransferase